MVALDTSGLVRAARSAPAGSRLRSAAWAGLPWHWPAGMGLSTGGRCGLAFPLPPPPSPVSPPPPSRVWVPAGCPCISNRRDDRCLLRVCTAVAFILSINTSIESCSMLAAPSRPFWQRCSRRWPAQHSTPGLKPVLRPAWAAHARRGTRLRTPGAQCPLQRPGGNDVATSPHQSHVRLGTAPVAGQGCFTEAHRDFRGGRGSCRGPALQGT